MLNRRILRTKVFKAIYSYAENPRMTLKEAEAALEISCESVRDLYLFLLSVVGPLTEEARSRIEAARSKFNPTEEERNPNMRFVENRIAPLLMEDPDFTKLVSKKKFSWDQYDVFLRHLYESVRERKYFRDYMDKEECTIEDDAKLWCRIFEREFDNNPELDEILEDMSIYWNDDVYSAVMQCKRSLNALAGGERWNFPTLFFTDADCPAGHDSDKLFVYKLLRTSYARFDEYTEKVAELTPGWTKDRLCATDLALIVCGISESEVYPKTPIRIIINEYVEISKYYSTPESSSFVNGLLDKLINKQQN